MASTALLMSDVLIVAECWQAESDAEAVIQRFSALPEALGRLRLRTDGLVLEQPSSRR